MSDEKKYKLKIYNMLLQCYLNLEKNNSWKPKNPLHSSLKPKFNSKSDVKEEEGKILLQV